MAKARITTPEGIVVQVDGTPAEVAAAVQELREQREVPGARGAGRPKSGPVQIPDLIGQLKEEEFFRAPRGLGDIKKKLADLGHHYPVTTLSGAMQAQAKKRALRRFKQDGKYVYVQ